MATLWDEVRRDFPALDRHVYLNAAAASPTPRPVREAVTAFYAELESDARFGWPAWQMASSNTNEHYREHVAQIEAWLGKGG